MSVINKRHQILCKKNTLLSSAIVTYSTIGLNAFLVTPKFVYTKAPAILQLKIKIFYCCTSYFLRILLIDLDFGRL